MPAARRNFIDGAAARLYPTHAAQLVRYRQLVARRNFMLRTRPVPGDLAARLAPWDEQVATVGMELIARRRRAAAGASPSPTPPTPPRSPTPRTAAPLSTPPAIAAAAIIGATAFFALLGLSLRVLRFDIAAPLLGFSAPGALASMFAAIGIAAARPTRWLLDTLAGRGTGAVVTRWLLPAAFIVQGICSH